MGKKYRVERHKGRKTVEVEVEAMTLDTYRRNPQAALTGIDDILAITRQAPGAWVNGTHVAKRIEDPGDAHRVGALAVVRGSIEVEPLIFAYFVEWEDTPGVPVFVEGRKLRRVDN